MSSSEGRTRREILADAATAAAAASLAGLASCFPDVGGSWPSCKETDAGANGDAAAPAPVTPAVVEVLREDSVLEQVTKAGGREYVIQPDVVATMVDAGLTALARQVKMFNGGVSAQDGGAEADDAGPSDADGGADSAEAGQPEQDSVDNPWKILLPNYQAGTRIGLKANCLSGALPTSIAVLNAIIASLRDKLGVDPTTIVVWDRYLKDITDRGKYTSAALCGARLMGNLVDLPPQGVGIDGAIAPDGPGYGPKSSQTVGCLSPRLSRVLLEHTDLTINCPVLKTHDLSGITAAMKSVYGIVDDPASYHDTLQTALPKLYALPAIRNSISLTIVDALGAVIAGTNSSGADSYPRRVLLAQDPVALDSYALDLTNQLRAALPHPPLAIGGVATQWLDNAVGHGLGTRNYTLIQA